MSAKPEVFVALTLAEARARSLEEQKLLLIDVSADWCQPCKHMNCTTWRAPDVVSWVHRNAIAVQLESDADVAALSVQAFPTLILERAGVELDRTSGAKNADALIKWLDNARSGRTELDALRDVPLEDIRGRYQLAKTLISLGHDDEATKVCVWLWRHALEYEPSWVGVRGSFFIGTITEMVERNASSRARFAELRDEALQRRDKRLGFLDWVNLCGLLDDTLPIVEWLSAITPETASRLGVLRNRTVWEASERHDRWADFGRLIIDAAALIRDDHASTQRNIEALDEDYREHMHEVMTNGVRDFAEVMRASLIAADRSGEADALVVVVRELRLS